MKLVEMDQEIAEREEMSIPDIFATYGEEYFRNLETELLKELQTGRNCIISCGGGVALRSENVVEMKKNGKVVLLTASPETIYMLLILCLKFLLLLYMIIDGKKKREV